MALTPEQILEIRRQYGIPEEGFGAAEEAKRAQPVTTSPTPEERVARRRNLVAQQKAKEEANKPQGLLGKMNSTVDKIRGNFFGNIAVEGLRSVGNTAARIYTNSSPALTGVKPLIPESVDTPIGSFEPKYSDDPKKRAGQYFEDFANAYGGEGTYATGKEVFKGALFKSVKEGAQTGAVSGATMGAGQALQEDKSMGDVLKDTAIGAAAGTALGGAIGTIGGVAGAVRKFVKPNLNEAKLAYKEALNFGRAELNQLDSPHKVDEVVDLLLEEGVPIFTQDKGSKFATKGEPVAVLKNSMDSVENTLDDVLNEFRGSQQIDFERIRTAAKRKIKEATNISADTKNRRISFVDDLINQEIELHGRLLDPPTANGVKRGFWNLGYDMSAAEKTNSARYIGNALKEAVEKTVGGDEIVTSLNRRLGLLQEGVDILERLDGKSVRGGKLGALFGRITGAVMGGNFGAVGSLVGSELTGKLSQFITDPARITEAALQTMRKAGVLPKTVKTIQEAKNFIAKVRSQRASTLALPEPAIKLPGKTPSPSGIIKDAPAPQIQSVNKPKYTSPTTEAIDRAVMSPTLKAIERATKSIDRQKKKK